MIMVVLVFIAGLNSHLGVLNGIVHCLKGCGAMSAFVVSSFLKMLAGLLQGFQGSLHVRLIFTISIGGAGHCGGDAENSKHQGKSNCFLQSFHR